MSELEAEFTRVADSVKTARLSGSPTNAEKLHVYSLFKQATVGDCTGDRPGMFSMEARAKWDAWNAVRGKSKEDAMRVSDAQLVLQAACATFMYGDHVQEYIAEVQRQQKAYA